MYCTVYIYAVFCPHWLALVTTQHKLTTSDELTTDRCRKMILIMGRTPGTFKINKFSFDYTINHKCYYYTTLYNSMWAMSPWNFIYGIQCPHGPHASYATATSQIIHIYAIEIVLSIYWINSTKCKLESNHHSKYHGRNTAYVQF